MWGKQAGATEVRTDAAQDARMSAESSAQNHHCRPFAEAPNFACAKFIIQPAGLESVTG